MIFVVFVAGRLGVLRGAQPESADAALQAASGGRMVRLGSLAAAGSVAAVPLEVYVARVLAGEGEPKAADAASEALAVAIRTFAVANAGRHAADGFDLCDTTHCQVPRAATAATRRAALATAGQILTYQGRPAEVFYSASCGGRSESASQVWPGAQLPYLVSRKDDVHDDDEPWTVDLTLREIQEALARAGFEGQRLRDVRIEARNPSGRASRLSLPGLEPDEVTGERFRAAIGTTTIRSTAFAVQKRGNRLRITGRGFGHGVGMCVIGAGRRALRGDSAEEILAQYFPDLTVARVDPLVVPVAPPSTVVAVAPAPTAPNPPVITPFVARVPATSSVPARELQRLAARAVQDLSSTTGVSPATSVTIQLHDTLEDFRSATGRPWWIGAVVTPTAIHLAPSVVLAQRDGLEQTIRIAVAELLVADALAGRPEWVRVGASRFLGRLPAAAPAAVPRVRCPSDAELTLAVSATAQREAESRAEACFAREYSEKGDWRLVGSR